MRQVLIPVGLLPTLLFLVAASDPISEALPTTHTQAKELSQFPFTSDPCLTPLVGTVLNLSLSQTTPPFTIVKLGLARRGIHGTDPVHLWSPNAPVLDKEGRVTSFLSTEGAPWFKVDDHVLVMAELNQQLGSELAGLYKPYWVRYLSHPPTEREQSPFNAVSQSPLPEQPVLNPDSFDLNLHREFIPDSLSLGGWWEDVLWPYAHRCSHDNGVNVCSLDDLSLYPKGLSTCLQVMLSPAELDESYSLIITPEECEVLVNDFAMASRIRGLWYPVTEEYRVLTVTKPEMKVIADSIVNMNLKPHSKRDSTSVMSMIAIQSFRDGSCVTGDTYLAQAGKQLLIELIEQSLQNNEEALLELRNFSESK